MTPAQELAAAKPRKRPNRNAAKPRGVWECRVRERREALNLSLRDVAGGIGLSATALHQIELGGDPMLTTARKLATFFGCRVETLWPGLAGASS